MTNAELVHLLSKQWACVSDIQKIASCGRDNAIFIRNTITRDIKDNGKNLPISKKKLVPMESVIEYFNLNLEHICFMAEKELKMRA